ncbi:acyltransferase family protein [uncultured Bacteroides sp.]|uniref:acyltransferase n=1 Tax=uncultured Bacteroides sp. TaxID=162156 RepID=UPI00260D6FE7|nr:acyltransferase family protein [uncultured Bacteroides sp.]
MAKERIVWIDALNIMACAGVFLLHCTNKEVHAFSGTPSANWYIGLFTHSFVLWPVNIFFMLSGFTLMRKSLIHDNRQDAWGGVKTFYMRRWQRLGVPLILWNLFYMCVHIFTLYLKGEPMETIPTLVRKFVLFEYNGFMWFFVPLILIYLSMPFLAVFVLNAGRKLLRLFLITGLLLSWIPPLDADFTARNTLADIYLLGSRFLYFTVLGYYVGHYEISRATGRRIYMTGILSMIVMYAGTALLTLYAPGHYKYFLQYTNVPCILSATAVFLFVKNYDWQRLLARLHIREESLAHYSSLSLGIYLVQSIGFKALHYFKIPESVILIRFVVMYAFCVLIVWVMKRIPLVKGLVP